MPLRLLLFLTLVLVPVMAGSPPAGAPGPGPFLGAAEARMGLALPPPPVPGSVEALADLEVVLQVQAWRSPAEEAFAQDAAHQNLFSFAPVLGAGFRRDRHPAFAALAARLERDIRAVVGPAKDHFNRLRPSHAEVAVRPSLPQPHAASRSYPSGHATEAHLYAAVLGELFPERRDALEAHARRLAWARILGGVHYPTDLEAGRRLAQLLFQALRSNTGFQQSLEACRTELAAGVRP